MAVVIPAAIRTASTSYIMLTWVRRSMIHTDLWFIILTMPRVTLSAAVKIARRMKLIGKELEKRFKRFNFWIHFNLTL